MLSIFFTTILGGASLYFLHNNDYATGIILLIWTLSRIMELKQIKRLVDIANNSDIERKCNISIDLILKLEEILKHASVEQLFLKLQNRNKTNYKDKGEWINNLLANYNRKYNGTEDSEAFISLTFHIKNNLLFKNGKIEFKDVIYHELYIPYDYIDADDEMDTSIFHGIEKGLNIRVLLVNGIIKLQIGGFSKEYSPMILRDGSSATFINYETISSFPLMYFSYEYKLPLNYLNLTLYAIDSYKESFSTSDQINKLFNKDWMELNEDVRDYIYVCNNYHKYFEDFGKSQKILQRFREKRESWLLKEDFKDPLPDDYLSNGNYDILYINKFLRIDIKDYNYFKELGEKYTFTDYHEDRYF
jgi:hypothetical protein